MYFFLRYEDVLDCFNYSASDRCYQQNQFKEKGTIDFYFGLFNNLCQYKPQQFLLRELIDFCFKGVSRNYIAITKSEARQVDDKKSYMILFDKGTLKLTINYLLDNCYFTVGNSTFRKIIRIPIGSDAAPFMANLFFYCFENKWILNMKK